MGKTCDHVSARRTFTTHDTATQHSDLRKQSLYFQSKPQHHHCSLSNKMMQYLRFYIHGRQNSTVSGWKKHQESYPDPDPLKTYDLSNRVMVVTGANSGIGYECARYLALQGSKVYMVCRNETKAAAAREQIIETCNADSSKVVTVIGDLSLKSGVNAVIDELKQVEPKIDALICNAGALLPNQATTEDKVETTMALHYLFGTKLLAESLVPLLRESQDPRVVVVASGGLYCAKLPTWNMVLGKSKSYNGEHQYSSAKRAQVLQCERWAKDPAFEGITTVSVHPGWTQTPGVDGWLGRGALLLQPMRNLWQGSEGILWLATAPSCDIQNGKLYLDRAVQPQHLSSTTENSKEEIEEFFAKVEEIVPLRA